MRLINLDALNKYPIRRHRCDKKNANPHFINGIESVLEYANELPVVEERQYGYWKEVGSWHECSCCKQRIDSWDRKWMEYCSVCGAKMDGDSK